MLRNTKFYIKLLPDFYYFIIPLFSHLTLYSNKDFIYVLSMLHSIKYRVVHNL